MRKCVTAENVHRVREKRSPLQSTNAENLQEEPGITEKSRRCELYEAIEMKIRILQVECIDHDAKLRTCQKCSFLSPGISTVFI